MKKKVKRKAKNPGLQKMRKARKQETRRKVWVQMKEGVPNVLRLGPDGWITAEPASPSRATPLLAANHYLSDVAKNWGITKPTPIVIMKQEDYIKLCDQAHYNFMA